MHREPTNSLNSTQSIFLTSKRYQPTTALNTTTMLSPDPPTSAPVAMTATSPNTTSTTSPESSNTAQPAARAKKTTCQRCKKQFESGNELHKHLRESCRYTHFQRETQLNTTASSRASLEALHATQSTASSKASPYQTTTLSLDQVQTSTSGSTPSVILGYSSNAAPSVSSVTDQMTTSSSTSTTDQMTTPSVYPKHRSKGSTSSTDQTTALNADQNTTPESNDLVELSNWIGFPYHHLSTGFKSRTLCLNTPLLTSYVSSNVSSNVSIPVSITE